MGIYLNPGNENFYDGYRLKDYEIYNPESLVLSIMNESYGSYWGSTSTYEAISDRIRENFAGTKDAVIRMLAGESTCRLHRKNTEPKNPHK